MQHSLYLTKGFLVNFHAVSLFSFSLGVAQQQGLRPALTISVGPVVVHAVPHLLVDGRHGLHVALPPLPAQVLGLDFQQLEHVELHHGLLHLQGTLQDRG